MPSPRAVLIDDRLLIDEILVGLPGRRPTGPLSTTSYWYYRACRAAVAGGAGHLAGPFAALPLGQRGDAIHRLLALPDHIDLPEPRRLVPVMAELARHHDRLNLLNLEAVAAASIADATVWLSSPAAAGVLPAVLESEGIRWREVRLPA